MRTDMNRTDMNRTDMNIASIPLAPLGLGGSIARPRVRDVIGCTGPVLPGSAVRLAVAATEPLARPVFAGAESAGRPRAIAAWSSAPATPFTTTEHRATTDQFGPAPLHSTQLDTTHLDTTHDGTTLGNPSSRRPQS